MKKIILSFCCVLSLMVVGGCATSEAGPKETVETFINEYYNLEFPEEMTEDEFMDKHFFPIMDANNPEASQEEIDDFVNGYAKYLTQTGVENFFASTGTETPVDFVINNNSHLAVESIDYEVVTEEEDFADYRVTVKLKLTSRETSEVYETSMVPRVTLKNVDNEWLIDSFDTSGVNTQVIE